VPGEVTCPDDEFCDPDLDQCVVSCPFCSIDRTCYWEHQRNPKNQCQVCRSTENPYEWTPNDGAACDDGVFCNGADTCAGSTCSVHDGDPCTDDGVFCNGSESCDEATGSCVHSEDACGEGETCHEEGQTCCETHDHLVCNGDGDVAWVDGCGRYGEVVEECAAAPYGGCFEGECICSGGWTGPGCDQCIMFVAATGDDGHDGRSWAQAKATLQAAISSADASGCPEVWVAEGIYSSAPSADPNEAVVLFPGLRLYGGFAGTESRLTQRDVEAHPTVIDGELGDPASAVDNVCRAVVLAEGSRLDGFTVRNGSGELGCFVSIYGSGITAHGVEATVAHCVVTENGSSSEAGMRVTGSSRVQIHDTIFENNTSFFGALSVADAASVDVTDTIFRMNTAYYGGSAITMLGGTELVAVRCNIEDNDSPGAHGPVALMGSSTGSLTSCIFSENNADAGGVYNGGGGVTLVNCLIAGNEGTLSGGVYADGVGPTVLQSCTVAANNGDDTGGIHSMSDLLVVRNTILWGNASNAATLSESQILYSTGTLPFVRYSTVEGDGVFSGQGNQNMDPLFVNEDPGVGPLDLHLDVGSPCIDAGSTALLLADEADLDGDGDVAELVPFDLDGSARVAGASVDMGAYETP
jgi:hypothetical protein